MREQKLDFRMFVDEHRIPNGTTYQWSDAGKPIVHVMLTIGTTNQPGMPSNSMTFGFKEVSRTDKVDDLKAMRAYALAKATAKPLPAPATATTGATPYDIFLTDQCWLLLELDPTVNWQFAQKYLAVTAKLKEEVHHAGKAGHNMQLWHVYPDGTDTQDPEVFGKPGCRFVFFAVVHRGHAKKQTSPDQFFNLNIEFYQELDVVGNRIRILPTIIDPDVGNNGSDDFPNPP